ncbi:MAG: type II toxin-antitoxin system VapC family toxin [Myxococcaceae bacterium]|nr:type II toxin-antitoxin system VapC family toxin [Myxococcaceae bacterium]
MKVAFDTNAYRQLLDGDAKATSVLRTAERICLPVPVLAELRFGFLNGSRARVNLANLDAFVEGERVEVLACDDETARRYAELRLQLKRQGTPIPMNDIWIAALTLQHGATLFTRDADFDHLPQLSRV